MIEIRNFKMFDDEKAIREDKFSRAKKMDEVLSIYTMDEADDDGHFRVRVLMKYGNNVSGLFDSYEKADAFFNAVAAMLPDSSDKKQTIDIKDFE